MLVTHMRGGVKEVTNDTMHEQQHAVSCVGCVLSLGEKHIIFWKE